MFKIIRVHQLHLRHQRSNLRSNKFHTLFYLI